MKQALSTLTLAAYLAIPCSGLLLDTGCAAEPIQADPARDAVTIQIRFHQALNGQAQAFGLWSALLPAEYTDVGKILVDVSYATTGQVFNINFELAKTAANQWQGTIPFMPRDEQFRFSARAYDSTDALIFSGETLAILTTDDQSIQIPLAPAQDQQTLDLPRMSRIAYPAQITAGQEVDVIFTVEASAGEDIDYTLTSDDPSTPFLPASGTLSFSGTVVDFYSLYAAPEVTADTDFAHQIQITAADGPSSVSIVTNFQTHVVPRPAGSKTVDDAQPSVLFNPVILGLTANGTEIANAVQLQADVSDDGAAAQLAYQWRFTPAAGTPTATFIDNGQGNPAVLGNYTTDVQGTISLAVTDENGGTTTLYYQLLPDQFADIVDNTVAAPGKADIQAGESHTCMLTAEGKVRCWGYNTYGQLGYGNTNNVGDTATSLPYTAGDVPLPSAAQQIATGASHTCALLETGFVYCWGRNNVGQLGHGRTDNLGDDDSISSWGSVPLGVPVIKIAAAGNQTCAILEGGALHCWGYNGHGELGYGHTNHIGDNEDVFSVGDVPIGAPVKDIALGYYHTCVLLESEDIRCWGYNLYGQLGYAHTTSLGGSQTPDVLANVSVGGRVRKLAAGSYHTCALLETGDMRCWGYGYYGQLGYGGSGTAYNIGDNEHPTSVGTLAIGDLVRDITVGGHQTCARLFDGRLKCWGYGLYGQLGYGSTVDQVRPPTAGIDLTGLSIHRITTGAYHTCALFSTGAARCWGHGANGRLGYGNTSHVYSPASVGNISVLAP